MIDLRPISTDTRLFMSRDHLEAVAADIVEDARNKDFETFFARVCDMLNCYKGGLL